MPNLLAVSVEGEVAPSFDLHCLEPGQALPDGWGIGYYPAGEPSASVLKEPAPRAGSIRNELVKAWDHLASSLFVVHVRRATWGSNTDANTQPFCRSYGARDWLIAHSGSLEQRFDYPTTRRFQPVGSTDSEQVFCELMSRIAETGAWSLREVDPALLRSWFEEIDTLGNVSLVLTDGHDLCAYVDANGDGGMYLTEVLPPYTELRFRDADLGLDLTRRGSKSRKVVVLSSNPVVVEGAKPRSRQLEPGTVLFVRQGAVVQESARTPPAGTALGSLVVRSKPAARPTAAPVRRYRIVHRTTYRYETPVERSTHLLRLTPYDDRLQRVLAHSLEVSVPDVPFTDYDDVFGNRARRVIVDQPYRELTFLARSEVEVRDTNPLSFRPLHARSTIPLVWMPWQRHMLMPYLLPPELPDTQLEELIEYAQSFVRRNDSDLIDTLLDINHAIFSEYAYQQGATHLYTTPFEVYTHRRGVCQDFTNLFICLARLLGVPARYTCGYVYVPPQGANRVQSLASHAWVQLYLPEHGWSGFDPTNGILTQTEHVRVAVGRNYVDATPTSGTLYVGGGPETLEVDVKIELLDERGEEPARAVVASPA
ncbi:MAG: class II glutamine amidotransferase [Polyangiaceae bacterium]|nr:class II glutamine amidotransferase [Polyangiaceae bacterium]